ncbi:MAG: nucleoside 2-deoxyribosyltransferase [Lentisphaeria bacterium]|nr:nucleoside 2-deoxyribosyltransferase [Lentisphaeria bacterium]
MSNEPRTDCDIDTASADSAVGARRIYFAGPLFSHKELTGNRLLADAVDAESASRYTCVLPQDIDVSSHTAKDIRDADFGHLLDCDCALFNFDGAELDSGTVVEFIFAKMIDRPAVLLRTDFRTGGDQCDGDPWNLMCSFYPRTRTLLRNGMEEYRKTCAGSGSFGENVRDTYGALARDIVHAFDAVFAEPPLTQHSELSNSQIEAWARLAAGL